MNIIRTSKSPSVLLLIWAFITVFTVDAANADDLISGTPVIHPVGEASSATSLGLKGTTAHGDDAQRSSILLKSQSPKRPTIILRVIVDQDSPSVPAEPLILLASSAVPARSPHVIGASQRNSSYLYLLHRSLLL